MPTQQKIDQVKNLTDKLAKAKAFFLADYRGLSHQQLESLKKSLKKVQGEFVVAKNTLLKLALKKNEAMNNETMLQFETELKNPTAALFAYEDEIAPIKAVSDFMKAHQLPKIKIGFFSGKIATDSDFKKLASLPSKEVLYATLAVRLKGPIYGLHNAMRWNLVRLVVALDNVKGKKPAN
ncbi:50S ribosomal protein L10 [Candidatus Gottesmanbacteria bacterium RIFCSPHIGHO2_01_FULL_39_10]|uniref:Large ribosomal subunit protein uL10 n=1 Tax=Candidatus Gottesmanbacteria bacterium RIFCSPHIGHO2_01_FULL_39_10 TaxID=1798375 RepID=A0A1F5ZPM1_9BACT|nr:MAG: 50S ribosomal protein L10 [Candidatus Gottesmanbacteria bacterium RIFCSPHIGHO2_01_FULL_39_10]